MNRLLTVLAVSTLLAACGDNDPVASGDNGAPTGVAEEQSPQELFMARLREHCGRAYEGRIVANEPPMDDDPFEDARLVMHVRECSDGELKIPFHVGDDHSRTWVITRVAQGVEGMEGLRLKHDHRHEDGTDDDITMYGGDTANAGTPMRQEFPVDQESRDMFEAADMQVSMSNTWAMEIEANERFLYELSRPEGRLFQVEFDLSKPVELPPAPWGHELVKVPAPTEG